MNKLFIHIGPPKTGTTSFQYWLSNQTIEGYCYEGVIQPRSIEPVKLSNILASNISTDSEKILVSRIEELIEYNSIIISEELLSVTYDRNEWEGHLNNIYRVVSKFEPIIIITVRNPNEVIRSYYQQVYHRLDPKLKRDINWFADSDWCNCFNYSFLSSNLSKFGFTNIKYIDFTKLVSGRYKFNDIFEGSDKRNILLSKENISLKKGANILSIKKVSLKRTIADTLPKRLVVIFRRNALLVSLPDIHFHKKIFKKQLNLNVNEEFQDSYKTSLNRCI